MNPMLHIAVVEDDPAYARTLTQCLDRFAAEHDTSLHYDVFDDGAKIAGDYRPVYDIILMDIEMPGMDGITAAKEIRKIDADVVIIFITSMAKYAITGYTVQARAYVLKPINYYGLSLELQGAINAVNRNRSQHGRSLLLQTGSSVTKVALTDITYLESRRHDLFIHTTDGVLRVRGSLKTMEGEINDPTFARCGVSYVVNLAHVSGVTDAKEAIVNGDRVPISRQKYKDFMAALVTYLSGSASANRTVSQEVSR